MKNLMLKIKLILRTYVLHITSVRIQDRHFPTQHDGEPVEVRAGKLGTKGN